MKRGIFLSVSASALFASMFYYVTLLHPFDGGVIFSWRILLGLPILAIVAHRTKGWGAIQDTGRMLSRQPKFLMMSMLSAALFGTQLWLFVWAPLHGKALDVSMGYFLLPLAMVLVGRVVYQERLTPWQRYAVWMAALGVAHELWRVGGVSWATALVVAGYPPYFVLRRALRVGSLSAVWYDMIFLLPVAVLFMQVQGVDVMRAFVDRPVLLLLIPMLGVISSIALVMYLAASRMLPLGLFGILSYVEPVLLFWVGFLMLAEPVPLTQWLTYIPIWLAVLLVAIEGLQKWRAEARHQRQVV